MYLDQIPPLDTESNEERETRTLLHDKTGKSYELVRWEYRDAHHWNVLDRRHGVGYVWCRRDGDSFHLADWKIEEASRRPWVLWGWQIGDGRPVNYQRRGLGGALLPLVLQRAREIGCTTVHGMIVEKDVRHFPGLVAWYERHGFTFTPRHPGAREGTIVLRLR